MKRQRNAPSQDPTHEGRVIASHGRHCVVETPAGEHVICHPRGKKNAVVVGDLVHWQVSGDEGVIDRVQERRNLLYRQDEIRTKMFAANIDLVLVLVAAEPVFSEKQLTRALIAAEAAHIQPVIALNKSDLGESFAMAWARLAPYEDMGYPVIPLGLEHASEEELEPLRGLLAGRASLVLGPSGAGKSTLINRLVPGAKALTREISQVLNTGKHTTTTTSWYWIDEAKTTAIIDSPGFQEFGLYHIEPTQLPSYMPDLRQHVKDCRFYNCTHLHEPGCGVTAEVVWPFEPGKISENRYAIYEELFEELSAPRY